MCHNKLKDFPRTYAYIEEEIGNRWSTLFRYFFEIALDIAICFNIEMLIHETKNQDNIYVVASWWDAFFMMVLVFFIVLLGLYITCYRRHKINNEEE